MRFPDDDSAVAHIPHNIDAEQALLGAILFDNAAYERLSDQLTARHFYEPFHSRLFAAMEVHIRKGQLAEPIVLAEQFKRDPAFEELGGLRYLADLVDRAPPAANAPDFARLVYELSLRRELIRIGGDIAVAANQSDPELSAKDQIESAEQQLYTLAETGAPTSGLMTFDVALRGAVEMAAEAFGRDGGLSGVSTGLIDLDQRLGGLHGSDLIILAARPSMGKTALATNIAFNVAKSYAWEPQPDGTKKTVNGGVVAFFSLEMSAEQLAMRLLADVSGVSSDRLRKGEIDASEFGRVRDAALDIQSAPMFIDATGGISISKLAARARRLKRQAGLDLIVVDYLQQLSDLRESGSIEQDADVVMFIYREAYYKSRAEPREGTPEHLTWQEDMDRIHNLAEVIIGKQRHGPIGTVKLHFNADLTKFSNLARDGRFDPH